MQREWRELGLWTETDLGLNRSYTIILSHDFLISKIQVIKEVGGFVCLLFKFSFIYFFGLEFSLVVVHGLLLAVASPVVEHGI